MGNRRRSRRAAELLPAEAGRQDCAQRRRGAGCGLPLEGQPGARITTAALAKEVGVSEAALYRHFPSKAKMLEGLIEFIEESLFSRISRIMAEEPTAQARCRKLLALLLTFAELNPGMARLMTGEALQGETQRLRGRIRQVYDRLETQLRLILREWAATRVPGPAPAVTRASP